MTMAHRPRPEILVSTQWLSDHLDNPRVRIIDCSVELTPQPVGPSVARSLRADWVRGHIPNSSYATMIDGFASPGKPVPYAFPDQAKVQSTLRLLGVDDDTQLVLYGAGRHTSITRVWWVLRAYGLTKLSILDGGWEKWQREGRATSVVPASYPSGNVVPIYRPELIVDREAVLRAIDTQDVCIVNALSPEQFLGTGGSHFGRRGRIPRSVNVPAPSLLDPTTNTLLPMDVLSQKFTAVGALSAGRVIAYCGGGVAATAVAFALTMLGHENVAVYDGSLIDWCASPDLPMVTG